MYHVPGIIFWCRLELKLDRKNERTGTPYYGVDWNENWIEKTRRTAFLAVSHEARRGDLTLSPKLDVHQVAGIR